MSLEAALRLSEALLAVVFLQHSLEHIGRPNPERGLFALRICACLSLIAGFAPLLSLAVVFATSLVALSLFNGPYNGGSDRLGLLGLTCILIANIAPGFAELALGYLAVQLILSYFVSGWVKIANPDWRSGRALGDVFLFSAYPVSENLRAIAKRPRLLFAGSWAVMLFELAFPIALFAQNALIAALVIAGGFHLSNAILFGLNRFFWVWLSAYPVLVWFQARVF